MRLAALWFAVPAIVTAADVVTAEGTYGFYFGLVWPVLSLTWIGLAILSFVWCVRSARSGAWRRSALSLVLPAAMLLDPNRLICEPLYLGDVIHFASVKPAYDRQVAAIAPADRRVVEFDWGGMLLASKGVVYDATDEIGSADARRSRAWLARERESDLTCVERTSGAGVRPLWDHYYLVVFYC